MDSRDRRLRRELVILVILKLTLLAMIWWSFVRDVRVPVDAAAVARHVAQDPSAVPRQGESNAQ